MRFLIVGIFTVALTSCFNKAEVPAEVTVNVPETTQTIRVIHTVELSVQMLDFITQSCAAEVAKVDPPIPPELQQAAIDECIAASAQKFIADLMALITPPATASGDNGTK